MQFFIDSVESDITSQHNLEAEMPTRSGEHVLIEPTTTSQSEESVVLPCLLTRRGCAGLVARPLGQHVDAQVVAFAAAASAREYFLEGRSRSRRGGLVITSTTDDSSIAEQVSSPPVLLGRLALGYAEFRERLDVSSAFLIEARALASAASARQAWFARRH